LSFLGRPSSWIEYVRDVGAGGSNPLTPTNRIEIARPVVICGILSSSRRLTEGVSAPFRCLLMRAT